MRAKWSVVKQHVVPEQYSEALARHGFRKRAAALEPECLSGLYGQIPFRYPALFEALCLSYSWESATVGEVELAANPPGDDLRGLAETVRYDRFLWDHLLQCGYLILGRMSGGRYDPCAFNMNLRKGRDAPVVRVDHEQILSFQRLGKPTPLAPSFTALLEEAMLMRGRGRITTGIWTPPSRSE
jgi:hypothetical protein